MSPKRDTFWDYILFPPLDPNLAEAFQLLFYLSNLLIGSGLTSTGIVEIQPVSSVGQL